jgi:hypothetical protein
MSSNGTPRSNDNAHPSPPDATSGGAYTFLFFIIGIVASMVVGWTVFPRLLYSRKSQPFDFNHKVHLEQVSGGCQSCHFFRPDGSFAGVPRLAQCVQCHEEMQGRSADEAIFFKQYVEKGREVPWRVYARQPDSVFFSHAAHIYGAKLACETCHGPIGTSKSLKPYEENRITGYSRDIWGWSIAGFKRNTWDRMKMDDCAQCHQQAAEIHDSSAQTDRDACFACHK